MCRATVFRPILNKLGFDKLELLMCGGAPLPPETMALWHMYGINVVEVYSQTEGGGGIITGQRGPFPRPGNVGTVASGLEVRLADSGEIEILSADTIAGYWGNDKAAAALFTCDGWMRTGDVGAWVDGSLRLIDRQRDFIVTAGGKTLSPSFIENILRASPFVAEITVFGHGRKYLTALVEIDYDTVTNWARRNEIAYTGFTNLTENPRVRALIGEEISRANDKLSRVEQIKAFRILPKELDPEEENDPITPTRKVQREKMQARFSDLVESMYDDGEERRLKAAVGMALAS